MTVAEFLAASRIAVVGTVGRSGEPHLTPCWYRYSNGEIRISTTRDRAKYSNLKRDPRITVCVYEEPGAPRYAVLEGRAQMIEDASLWPETRLILGRYVAADELDDQLAKLSKQPRVIIAMTPARSYVHQTSWAANPG